MRIKKSDSGEIALPFTFRIAPMDRLDLELEHGTLGEFLNKVVKKELTRIKQKNSVSAKKKKCANAK